MDATRLFGVLVLGGAMIGLGCSDDAAPDPDPPDPAAEDGGPPAVDAGGPADAGGAPGELIECGFCPNDECCEVDADGNSRTRAGLMCCWGTSC